MRVMVHASDPLTCNVLSTIIADEPELVLVSPSSSERSDIVVVAVETMITTTMELLEQLRTHPDVRFCLIVNDDWKADFSTAVEGGVRAILWRAEFTPGRLLVALRAVYEGCGDFPPSLQGALLDHVCHMQRWILAQHGLNSSGLVSREINALRLASEGLSLTEISHELSYSERTVKYIFYGLIRKLNLRNRTHLVAYAIRTGVI